jgi:hypothetical protein
LSTRTKGKFIAGATFSVPPSDLEKDTLADKFLARSRGRVYDDFEATNARQADFASAEMVQKMVADAVARQRIEQDDEEEAISLLLLAA